MPSGQRIIIPSGANSKGLVRHGDRDQIRARVDELGRAVGISGAGDLVEDPNAPRWRIDSRWIEFECGCRAERIDPNELLRRRANLEEWDPIVFAGTPQVAVYDSVCERHEAGMNTYVSFGGFVTFKQWKTARRAVLMGKVRP